MGFFSKLKQSLSKTSNTIAESVKAAVLHRKLDDETLENLEETLISADMGVETSLEIIESLRTERFGKEVTEEELKTFLAEKISTKLAPCEKAFNITELCEKHTKPLVVLMVGVNGSGKTTTIGKLASQFKAQGKSVLLAAGDTYRAGAVEQLNVWAERTKAPIIKPEREGQDPSSVLFKAYEEAEKEGVDILIADTAGRLQNRKELMDELSKVRRVIQKHEESAPHEVLLVLDGTVGQNALSQAEAFMETAGVTGIVVTKLDSSAKGGVLVALCEKFKLPIYFIGIGESVEDLRNFEASSYAKAMVGL